MAFAGGEADHLVLDGGAIARACGLDLAGIHRSPVEIGADDRVRVVGRPGDMAGDLGRRDFRGQRRKRHRWVVAMLDVQPIPMDRPAIEAGRGAGLQTAHLQAKSVEGLR